MESKKSGIVLILLLCLAFLSGFTIKGFKDYDESSLYIKAMSSLNSNQFKSAVSGFQKVNEMYPFSYWGKRAQMMSAFVSYLNKDYKNATFFSTSYINSYPDGEDIQYVHYLRAESYFMRINNVDNTMLNAEKAEECFKYIADNFPNYAAAAKSRLKKIHELMAAKYLSIGIFYENNMQYHSAISRFNEITKNYKDTKYYDEALFRLFESYSALKLKSESEHYQQMLRKGNSKWLKHINN